MLCSLTGSLQGEYFPLLGSNSYVPPGGMSVEEEQRLQDEGLLFEEPDAPVLVSSGYALDWPDARGVFVTSGRDLAVNVNELDHLCVHSVEKSGALKATRSRHVDPTVERRFKVFRSPFKDLLPWHMHRATLQSCAAAPRGAAMTRMWCPRSWMRPWLHMSRLVLNGNEGFAPCQAFVEDGKPRTSPMMYGREGDMLYLHGHVSAGVLRNGALLSSSKLCLRPGSLDVCFCATLEDGLVLGRSGGRESQALTGWPGMHSSMNYRCVMVHGEAVAIRQRLK